MVVVIFGFLGMVVLLLIFGILVIVFFWGCWGERGGGGVGVGVDWNLAQSLSLLVATLSASLFPSRLSRLVPS